MRLKDFIFALLGKEPEAAVVVSFCSGPPELAAPMIDEVRRLVPDRAHYAVSDVPIPGVECVLPRDFPRVLGRKRIGLAPVLIGTGPEYAPIRRLALRHSPLKLLAYNKSLERHHLHFRSPLASFLFLRGVPLDRIWLRPKWVPFRREESTQPESHVVYEGRPLSEGKRRVAILSPYFPYPLSHGGAVRIFNLLREASRDFDIFLFSFAEKTSAPEGTPVLGYVSKAVVFRNPRYREPRWASLVPPEVNEFHAPYVATTLAEFRRAWDLRFLQTEYTQMASYGGDILVEHDVTFDLYNQICSQERSWSSWWNWYRWQRYERAAVRRFRRVVTMSEQDAKLLQEACTAVIPNGVDLHRFRPEAETEHSERLLFVGSFAHFPNVVAFRWFLEEVWPKIAPERPHLRWTVIAGKNPSLYWNEPIPDPRIQFHGFISDVRPFYAEANIVIVPTRFSAGTNLKVIEAMAMERAVVSTISGCNGLAVGDAVRIADSPQDFANAVRDLLDNPAERRKLAAAGRRMAETRFGWENIGRLQRALWREMLTSDGVRVRKGTRDDLSAMTRIQLASHGASQWEPDSYFTFDVRVAERCGEICGFMVSRTTVPGETEILNVAVAPEARRLGVGTSLIESLSDPDVFLEVRESNTAAKTLYQKLGFRVVGRREDYYDDPVEPALVMRRFHGS